MNASEIQGIPPQWVHRLDNGSYVTAGMFDTYGPGANCTLDLCPVRWTVYQYRPSVAASAVFIALYALALLVHVALGVRWRAWGYMTFMMLGCGFEIAGYAARILLYNNPWSFLGFLIQMVFITSGPVYYTAAIYVTISRAIRYYAPELSRVPPRVLYWSFISADLLCLILQAAGGAMSSSSSGSSTVGLDMAMAGLILQCIVLGIFSGFFADYMIRYVRRQRKSSGAGAGAGGAAIAPRQKLFFAAMAAAIILILVRCAYRVDELGEGYVDSDRITNQPLFIALEGVVVYLAVICLTIGHPGYCFKDASGARPDGHFADSATSVEKGEGRSASQQDL